MDRTAILAEARAAAGRAADIRRAIHRRPELGNREFETSALVEETLRELGWEISRPMGTSVVALLRGSRPGKTVAFRADMDALPIQEETGLPFASEIPGVMHACGHDLHTAGLLGAAMVLAGHRGELRGNVKLLFQPDEEGDGGATRMIAAGCLENPHVDAVFGAHVDPDLPTGCFGVKPGTAYAASAMFTVTIRGAGCHGASPHEGIDAVAIGAQVISAAQQIVSRRMAPTDATVITFGAFHAGTASNVIADKAELKGIIRTLPPENRARVCALFRETVEGVCAAMGAQAEVRLVESYPGVFNWPEAADQVAGIARRLLGPERVRIIDTPTTGTEDFGCFIRNVPGCFYWIGVANPEAGPSHPLHSARFSPDEAALEALIALHVGVAMDCLV